MATKLTNNSSRTSLIYALNAAMHKNELPNINVDTSRFDKGTGTLYCSDTKTSYSDKKIQEAIRYFDTSYVFYINKNDEASYKMAEYCKIASESIKIMITKEEI